MTRAPGGAPHDADLYLLLIEHVRDYAIFVLDATGHVLTWNPAAQRMKGYSADEIIGRHFSVFYPEEDLAWDKPGYELKEAARVGRFEDEGLRLRKDGSRFWANVVITALTDSEGKLVGFAKITRDLTERRRREEQERELAAESAARMAAEQRRAEVEELNEQLQEQAAELESQIAEAQQLTEELELTNTELEELRDTAECARAEAEAANRSKMDFLAAMSHELRTPLNAIAGYVELMELGIRGPITEEQRSDLERVKRSERYLLSLVNDILNFAKLETGSVPIRSSDVRIAILLQEVDDLMAPQAQAKGVSYHTEPCDPALSIHADAEKMQQILLNLIGNAIKFTGPGGSITLDCRANAREIAIVVLDTGCGIPPEQLEAIFDPFVQIGRSLTYPIAGAGLGLAISRDLARAMGGDIRVESTLGEGATFTLVLPRNGGSP
ncbi:MAG TPA: ATP-binding protein [Gemmatimonadaceae bacterium]|nr:ATP-binding protein [Gemmatimonadaceae bacterium]